VSSSSSGRISNAPLRPGCRDINSCMPCPGPRARRSRQAAPGFGKRAVGHDYLAALHRNVFAVRLG
jgi:hypothetical protein